MPRPPHRTGARDWIVDVSCVILAVLVALMVLVDLVETRHAPKGYVLVAAVLAVPGCALLWWRRRWPVGVAVALLAPAMVTESVGGAVLVAIFTVAVHRPGRVALAVAAAHLAVTIPYSMLLPDPNLNLVEYHTLTVVLLAAVLAWGSRIRARRQLVDSLRERAARAEAEAASHAERLRGLERERIAREMHDVLAHRISLVSLHAGALEIRPDLPAEAVAHTAGIIRASAHQALEELREILGVLRAGGDENGLGPQPGLADLDRLIAECRTAGTPIHFDRDLPADVEPPATVSRTAYRIVQEGLTNARKHAPDAPVCVRLARTPAGELHVALRNPLPSMASVDRTGAGPALPGSRTGLVGLGERVSLAGGRLDHGARRAADGAVAFHLEAWLPWSA